MDHHAPSPTPSASDTEPPKRKRSPLLRIFLILFLVGLLASSMYVLKTPGLRPVMIYPYEEAILRPDETTHDLGEIPTDVQVPHTFIVYNVGGKHLRIQKVETSCGCTATRLDKKVIAPGDFTKLDVRLDTSIKLGHTRKSIEIFSNDPKHPVYTLYLTGNVVRQMDSAHKPIKVKDKLALFKGQCASCHVDKGKGQSGEALFMADCAMCHGYDAEGRKDIAPGLLKKNYHSKTEKESLRAIIANGSARTPQMPPFHQHHGGPLNDDEIDSLIRFLSYKSANPN